MSGNQVYREGSYTHDAQVDFAGVLEPCYVPMNYIVGGIYDLRVNGNGTNTASATGDRAIAIGHYARATGNDSVALGAGPAAATGPLASADNTVAIGYDSESSATKAVSVGNSVTASGTGSVSLGLFSSASGANSVAAGVTCTASAANSVAVGINATASATGAVAVGGSTASSSAVASGAGAVAIGGGAMTASGTRAIGIGFGNSTGTDSIAIGPNARANADNAIAIGVNALSNAANSISIQNSITGTPDTIYLGGGIRVGTSGFYTNAVFGACTVKPAPNSLTAQEFQPLCMSTNTTGIAHSMTPPTVANMIIGHPLLTDNCSFPYYFVASSGDLTMNTNTGWTLVGSMTVTSGSSGEFLVVINSVSGATGTIYRV